MLSVFGHLFDDKIIYKLSLYILSILYFFQIGFIFQDIGNLIGLTIVLAGIWLPTILTRIINGKIVFGIILAANAGLLFFNIQYYFGYIITQFFNKDMTLSSRTYIWISALKNVAESSILGKGNPSSFGEVGWNYYNGELYVAHNQLLDIVVNGGILALSIYLIYLFIIHIRANNFIDDSIRVYFLMGIASIGVIMLADSVSPFLPIFIMYTFVMNVKTINEHIVDMSMTNGK